MTHSPDLDPETMRALWLGVVVVAFLDLRQGEGLAAQNEAADLKLRAERRLGQLLGETVRHEGGRPSKQSHAATVLPDGISKTQSSRWQLAARFGPREAARMLASPIRPGRRRAPAALVGAA